MCRASLNVLAAVVIQQFSLLFISAFTLLACSRSNDCCLGIFWHWRHDLRKYCNWIKSRINLKFQSRSFVSTYWWLMHVFGTLGIFEFTLSNFFIELDFQPCACIFFLLSKLALITIFWERKSPNSNLNFLDLEICCQKLSHQLTLRRHPDEFDYLPKFKFNFFLSIRIEGFAEILKVAMVV